MEFSDAIIQDILECFNDTEPLTSSDIFAKSVCVDSRVDLSRAIWYLVKVGLLTRECSEDIVVYRISRK